MAIEAILAAHVEAFVRFGCCPMALAENSVTLFGVLDEELRSAPEPMPQLFAKVVATVCSRVPVLRKSGKTAELALLIEFHAWTDSALVLVELELPLWKVRRLAYDSGEWFCSLSRTSNLPVDIDDSIDTSHPVLALAILRALVEARRRTVEESQPAESRTQSSARFVSAPGEAVCCDNFA